MKRHLTKKLHVAVSSGLRAASDEEFPFVVSVQEMEENQHKCGGVIIAPRWVLTVGECVKNAPAVRVGYGSSDSNQPASIISSKNIFTIASNVRHNLALIELESKITMSKKATKARLPRQNARVLATTAKLSGWKVTSIMHKHPVINVIDKYKIKFLDCVTSSGGSIHLEADQFCGYDEEFPDFFSMKDLGTVVSKDGVVLGLLPHVPENLASPILFVKISEHGSWIKETVGSDDIELLWVEEVPKDSASFQAVKCVTLILTSILIPRFV
ncbi:hypothetical protein RUM44_001817 [Polyplax serrata]|uniref:Peptidase S1 domain-containing protein n=1 Tax=Polyplax serrata TaxID=468196 RepID=A0ABR1AL58_POLSC